MFRVFIRLLDFRLLVLILACGWIVVGSAIDNSPIPELVAHIRLFSLNVKVYGLSTHVSITAEYIVDHLPDH